MANNNYTVYKHTTPDGRIYIGCTGCRIKMRWQNGYHYKSNPRFTKAIKHYGWDSIKHEIIADGLSIEEATRLERILIRELDATNPKKGYNVQKGGAINYQAGTRINKLNSVPGIPLMVRCVETGEVFKTLTEGAHAKNTRQPNVSRCIKKGIKAGGYMWELVKQ